MLKFLRRLFNMKSPWKLIILASFCLVTIFTIMSLMHPKQVDAVVGRSDYYGYFYDKEEQCINNPACDDVLNGGIPTSDTSASALENTIVNYLNDGSTQDQVGASYIIDSMTDGCGGLLPSPSYCVTDWKKIIDADASGSNGCSINWNDDYGYTENTAYDQVSTHDVFSFPETSSDYAVVITCPNGHGGTEVVAAIKHTCGNPLTNFVSQNIPSPPQGTLTLKCSPNGYVVSGYDPDNSGAAVNYQIRYDSSSGGVKDSGSTYKGDNTFHSDTFTFGRTYVLMIQDEDGTYDQVAQATGPPCSTSGGPVTYPGCNLTTAYDPGSITYQTPSANPSYTPPGYPANSNTWSKSNIGSTVTSQTVITITDQSVTTGATDTLVPSTTLGTGRHEGTNGYWTYVPQETEVIVSVDHEEYALTHETYPGKTHIWEWTTYSTAGSEDLICYQASCTLLSVTGPGPGGAVIEGQPYTAWAQLNNTGQAPLPTSLEGDPLSITNGTSSPPNNNINQTVNPGSSSPPIEINGTAPSGGPTNINIGYPDYYGDGNIFNSEGFGTPCTTPAGGTTWPVYAPFTLTPSAHVTLEDAEGDETDEHPTQAVNTTYVTETGSPVSENVTSNLTDITTSCGSNNEGSTSNGGPFNPGTTYLFSPSPAPNNSYSYPTCIPLHAGDQYCAEIDVPDTTVGSNQAYVGPSGDIIGGQDWNTTACATVVNEPFFKVFNGGVSAGSSIPPPGSSTCSAGGELASWNNNDSGLYPADFGAGTQLHALASGGITGFASSQNIPPTLNGPATNLSFANYPGTAGQDTDSPALGGNFGNTPCYSVATAPTTSITETSSSATIGSGPLSGSGSYTYNVPNLTLNGGTIGVGNNLSVFVNGNVYITGGGILYGGDGGTSGQTAKWSSTSEIPSFSLVATGNIYIDPGVTELDGIYTAQPSSASSGGKIYTCGTASFTPVPATSLFGCNNQLLVYGSFEANQVNLMRTFGSLRDETPNPAVSIGATPGATAPLVWNDRGASNNPSGDTCTKIYEPSEPGGTNYQNNVGPITDGFGTGNDYLCVPPNDGIGPDGSPDQIQLSWTCDNFATGNPNNCDTGTALSTCVTNSAPYSWATWVDDEFCSNYAISFVSSSYNPTNGSQYCTSIYDPSNDVDGGNWQDAYICIPRGQAGSTTPASANVASPCSNAGIQETTETCAAEVFELAPEMYLSNWDIKYPSNGALQYKAITSLPPVL